MDETMIMVCVVWESHFGDPYIETAAEVDPMARWDLSGCEKCAEITALANLVGRDERYSNCSAEFPIPEAWLANAPPRRVPDSSRPY